MSYNPLVSIVIPVYNGSNYLKEAIDSALNQTYKNIEVIVVNDGSRDNGATEEIALSYGDKIRYFSKENGGVSSALNKGIEEMKGEYFSWLSHDDVYKDTKIENQVKLINSENADFIFMCGSMFIDKDSNPINRMSFTEALKEGCYSYDEMLSSVFKGNVMGGCTLLIPRVLFDKFGTFKTEIKYMQDLDMWYRFLTGGVGFVCHNKDVDVLSRVHPQQATVTAKDLGQKDADIVGAEMVERLSKLPEKDRHLLKEYMFLCCRNRSRKTGKKAYEFLNKAQKLSLSDKIKYVTTLCYGNIRPILVRCYYKVFYNIKVKK
ncbi:MAG: glycosyltransferase [Oscillospiraceae bacterium]|nr:glycosyltransferase [Oscillospiraceae bacterium]